MGRQNDVLHICVHQPLCMARQRLWLGASLQPPTHRKLLSPAGQQRLPYGFSACAYDCHSRHTGLALLLAACSLPPPFLKPPSVNSYGSCHPGPSLGLGPHRYVERVYLVTTSTC